jgi:hypothetical protein
MHIGTYIQLVHQSQKDLVKAFRHVAITHQAEPDIFGMCNTLAVWSEELDNQLQIMVEKYGKEHGAEPDRLLHAFFDRERKGSLSLLQDLQDLWLMANEADISAVVLGQGAFGLRDEALIALCQEIQQQSKRQAAWLLTRIKSAAPEALIAAG